MKNLLLIPILGLLVAPALAQVTNPGGEYIIQGVYSPTLMDAQKIDLRPEPIDTILPTLPVRYDLLPVKAEIPAKVDSIAAATVAWMTWGPVYTVSTVWMATTNTSYPTTRPQDD